MSDAAKLSAEELGDVCAKLRDIADRLGGLDSASGDARAFRLVAQFLEQQRGDIASLEADNERLRIERERQCDLPIVGWMPIETAPRDGTHILAWCVHALASALSDEPDDYRGPVIARWIEHNGGGWCWHGLAGKFTHWQPLPAPPLPTDKAGGQ